MWILRAAVCLAVPVLIVADDCSIGKDTDFTKPGPFLPEGAGKAVTVWSEVTTTTKQTYVVREVFDKDSNRYFLEFYDGRVFQKLLYDRTNNVFYRYTDVGCAMLEDKEKTEDFYKNNLMFEALELEDVPEKSFLGPASIFDSFSASTVDTGRFSDCAPEPGHFDRFIPCVMYRQCPALDRKLTFYYSEKGYELFNQNESQPLRVELPRGASVDILSVKIHADNSQDLFIPTGLSCENPEKETPVLPFDTDRRSFVGEVVTTTKDSDRVYVSQLNAMVVPSPNAKSGEKKLTGIYSFSSTSFKTSGGGDDLVPDRRYQEIHDVDHNVIYERFTYDDENELAVGEIRCKIYRKDSYEPELSIPGYGTIRLRSIFLEAPTDVSDVLVSHLGRNRMGSTATDVFEVTETDYTTGNDITLTRLVVSHHFHATTNKIVAVEINGYGDLGTKAFTVNIYINKYDQTITQLNEKLRIDDCREFIDHSESRWLQIGFEEGSANDVAQIERSAFQIREAVIEQFRSRFRIEPMRLPQINVDFVDQQVYINALLLERPLLDLAFQEASVGKDFKNPTRTLGIMSRRACQITCLGMKENDCTAISYCGATCSISNQRPNPIAPAFIKDSPQCDVAERGSDREMIVSSRILLDLDAAATTPATADNLKLSFQIEDENKQPKEVVITADSFDDTKNFDNVFHFDKDKVAIIESSFKVGMAKRRYKTESSASLLGSLDQEDCAIACKNRAKCESFSYCMNSRECMISGTHDINEQEVQEDDECIVYQKKYLQRFERYPGLTVLAPGVTEVVTNAESCAQKCVQRGLDCKSFEYCDDEGDCLLLSTHIAEAQSVDKNKDSPDCDHFSKKFLFDYAVVAGKRGTGDETTELKGFANITQETCAKLCSEWSDADHPCLSFDFCAPSVDNTGVCTLRTVDGQGAPSDSPTCDFFYLTVPASQKSVRHSGAQAIGLSILMMAIGAVAAVGGLVLYSKYG